MKTETNELEKELPSDGVGLINLLVIDLFVLVEYNFHLYYTSISFYYKTCRLLLVLV